MESLERGAQAADGDAGFVDALRVRVEAQERIPFLNLSYRDCYRLAEQLGDARFLGELACGKLRRWSPSQGRLALSYRNHTGRWEPIPAAATTPHEAAALASDILGPHLQAR